MSEFDQIFVTLKHWLIVQLANVLPESFLPVASAGLSLVPILIVFPSLFAITTVLERKGLGRIQNRYGPNRVGPFGFLQFAADGIKAIIKEDIVPRAADKVVHFLAPVMLVVPALLVYAVLPFGRNLVAIDLDSGLLFFFAVGAASELAVFMAGWSSRNKYALLGAMRAVAQMISYEIPLILSTVTVVMMAGTLSPVKIVEAQGADGGLLPGWFVFTPWGFAGFILFLIAANAEANRSPFDLPEGESELVAGYFTEYSGFKFALFFLAEYLSLFAVSALGITLFLGGWQSPFAALDFIPSWAWFFAKLLGLIVLFIWTRGTLPRLRVDQLMNFAWKFMLPLALINLLTAAAWHVMGPGLARWLVCSLLVVGPYLMLGRGLLAGKNIAKRVYRYANETSSDQHREPGRGGTRPCRVCEMTPAFLIIAGLTIAAAAAAMSLRNLIHSALAVALAFVGLAAAYLQLNAQFVGFAQILVYVGAVAILIVFAALLTRGGEPAQADVFSKTWCAGIGVTVAVLGVLTWAITRSAVTQRETPPVPEATVKQIGDALMTKFVLPLEVIGLLLTAALIGAVIIAMRDEVKK